MYPPWGGGSFRRMRAPLLGVALAAAVALPASARAQEYRPQVAFDRAISVTGGLGGYGERLSSSNADFGYKSSLMLGAGLDLPLTRRTGLLAFASVGPLSAQQTRAKVGSTIISSSLVAYSADVGFAARFKPSAPVFFFVGGGVSGATHYAAPLASGAPIEPEGAFAVGYDGVHRGPWGLRVLYAGHVVRPSAPADSSITAHRATYDWSLQVGGRFLLHYRAPTPERAP